MSSLTKGSAKLGLNGVIAGQVVSRAKVLVEAASEVNGRAGQVAASLASKERMPLQCQSSSANLSQLASSIRFWEHYSSCTCQPCNTARPQANQLRGSRTVLTVPCSTDIKPSNHQATEHQGCTSDPKVIDLGSNMRFVTSTVQTIAGGIEHDVFSSWGALS